MAVNTDFYGSTLGIRIRGGAATPGYTNTGIYAANFSGVLPATETAGQLNAGVNAGRFAFGDPIDGSIQTHGIQRNDDTYNTFANYAGIDSMGSTDNMAIEQSRNASIPILFGYHPRTSLTYNTNYAARPVSYQNVLWGVDKSGSPDGTSLVPVVQMDFKTLLYVPVVIASTNYYDSTPDQYGRYTLNSSWRSAVVMTLDTYINSYFLTYPVVQGVGLISFAVALDETGAIPGFELSKCRISNQVAPFRNIYYNWTAGTRSGGQRMPTDGTIITSGMDLCGPFMAQRDVTFNYTTTAGTTTSFTEPTGGNIPIILGCTCGAEGYRRQSPDLINDFWQGVTACVGANHIRMALQSNAEYVQIPVWHDAPQDPQMFKDAVHSMMSYLGVMWADEIGGIETGDTPLYIGIINEQGLTTGEYIQITNPDDVAQLASDNWINDTNYDPGRIDPNTYSDETELKAMSLKSSNIFNKLYLCNWDMYNLALYLYGIVAPSAASADDLRQKFLNVNPIDCIVNLMFFPFDLLPYFNGGMQNIKLGNQLAYYELEGGTRMPISGYTQTGSDKMQIILDLGSCVYFPTFGDFRDYEPYSSADLVIPYHGTISINPAEFMGHQIGVKCIVDLATGASIAYIFRDGLAVDSIPGTIGVQIPVSGIATADYNNAAFAAAAQLNAAKITQTAGFMSDSIGIVSAAMSANPLGVAAATSKFVTDSAASANAIDVAQYNVNHVKIPYRQTGTATPATSTAADQTARLIVRRPKMLPYDPEQFAHLNGYSCLRFGNLSEFSGYTVCSDVHISGNATAEEKNMIKSLLQSGVIL